MNFKVESGRRLKKARLDRGFSLAKLSEQVGGMFSPSRISNYEQGTRGLKQREANVLARVLGVEPAYLLCVDVEDDDMTPLERELLRNFRALPEKDRIAYARRIEVLALAYREPVPDENLPLLIRQGAPKSKKPSKQRK